MRHDDFAYRWLIEVRHNSDPPVAGDGSAIFFHIRRGVTRPTAGCTTMAEDDLVRVMKWLRANRKPCYALLPVGRIQDRNGRRGICRSRRRCSLRDEVLEAERAGCAASVLI